MCGITLNDDDNDNNDLASLTLGHPNLKKLRRSISLIGTRENKTPRVMGIFSFSASLTCAQNVP